MKHLNNMACMLALLAAGSTGFTACSSDDAIDGGGNNTSGAAGKMVKTSFALNIPYGAKSTRMTADNTQAGGNNFRGMADMRMLAFDTDELNSTSTSTKKIVLANGTDGAFDQEAKRRYIYRDVTIPVGTKKFLFYGRTDATSTKTGADLMNEKFQKGSILEQSALTNSPAVTTEKDEIALSGVTFNLEIINTALFNGTTEGSSAKVVADALKSVYNAKTTEKNWKDCLETSSDNVEKHAGTLFNQFKKLTAGSAASAKAALTSLKNGCGRNTKSDTETKDILYAVAKACDDALTALKDCTFPNDLGLPDGAAKGSFNGEGVFTYAQTGIPAATTGDNTLDYTKVTYPASLNYYVETPVKASDDAIENLNTTDGWPSYENWNKSDYQWPTNKWGDEVTNNTRSIALKNAIQYAVASLQTNVSVTQQVLYDNAKAKGGMLNDQSINVSSNGFKLTGILIGGQPSVVGYDYTPTTATNVEFDRTVYDRAMNEAENSITSSKSTTNYTLVLEGQESQSVYVTLELVNNTGTDFYGADGLVPNGSKFYLIGQLNPETDGGNVSSSNGNPNNLTQVFKKDYKTIANMRIGAKSLQKAYNTIPDLRSTQISLGLAVDLTWQNGITFNVDL